MAPPTASTTSLREHKPSTQSCERTQRSTWRRLSGRNGTKLVISFFWMMRDLKKPPAEKKRRGQMEPFSPLHLASLELASLGLSCDSLANWLIWLIVLTQANLELFSLAFARWACFLLTSFKWLLQNNRGYDRSPTYWCCCCRAFAWGLPAGPPTWSPLCPGQPDGSPMQPW